MKLMKHAVAVAFAAAVALFAFAGPASAGLNPNPYTFSGDDSITFVTDTALGTATCDVTGIVGTISKTSNVISGSITGGSVVNCSGPISSGAILFPVTVSGQLNVDGSTTLNVDVGLLVVNILGGHCLYAGTLSNTFAGPTSTARVSNPAVGLVQRLGSSTPIFGICSDPADANLDITLGNGTIG